MLARADFPFVADRISVHLSSATVAGLVALQRRLTVGIFLRLERRSLVSCQPEQITSTVIRVQASAIASCKRALLRARIELPAARRNVALQ